jgi:hypothetical protein
MTATSARSSHADRAAGIVSGRAPDIDLSGLMLAGR